MNIYILKLEKFKDQEPILFFAHSYKEAEELCTLKYPTLPNKEIKFLSSNVNYNLYSVDSFIQRKLERTV